MMWLTVLNSGIETTTADIHVVPAVHASHHSYGAISQSTASSPPAAVISEVVLDDSDVECDDTEHTAAGDDRPQVDSASIQHSSNAVLVSVDLPAPTTPQSDTV